MEAVVALPMACNTAENCWWLSEVGEIETEEELSKRCLDAFPALFRTLDTLLSTDNKWFAAWLEIKAALVLLAILADIWYAWLTEACVSSDCTDVIESNDAAQDATDELSTFSCKVTCDKLPRSCERMACF